MPTFGNIKVSVISQYELVTLPEHILPNTPEDKFRRYSGPAAIAPIPTPTSPFVAEPSTSPVITLYVPNTAGTRFWVDYAISGPQNPNSLYYFQLTVNGQHVVSWGCGEKEGFGGKTMFKMMEAAGEAALLGYGETAAMMMEDPMRDVGSKELELKVCRAKGRYRVNGDEQGNEMFPVGTGCESARLLGSMNVLDGGFIERDNSKPMYKYDLLDPLDHPFVTFRYAYKSWNQLEALGVIELPYDQYIDGSLTQYTEPPAVVAQAGPSFDFEQFINYDPFEVPETARSTCSIFVPPSYGYAQMPLDQSQQPLLYAGSPSNNPQTARSTCSIFLPPPPPTPPKSPTPAYAAPTTAGGAQVGATLTVPATPSVIVTPPSDKPSYLLPVPASAKKNGKKKRSKSIDGSGSSSSSSSSSGGSSDSTPVSGGTRIYDSSLPLRLSTSLNNGSNHINNISGSLSAPLPCLPAPTSAITPSPTNALPEKYRLLIATQELRIQRATEKGLAWLRANFPDDRVIPMPDPSLSRKEVGRRMMEIIGRRVKRVEAERAAAAAAAAAGGAEGPAGVVFPAQAPTTTTASMATTYDPRGHMMSQITRQSRMN